MFLLKPFDETQKSKRLYIFIKYTVDIINYDMLGCWESFRECSGKIIFFTHCLQFDPDIIKLMLLF